jgi:hypothetical protein
VFDDVVDEIWSEMLPYPLTHAILPLRTARSLAPATRLIYYPDKVKDRLIKAFIDSTHDLVVFFKKISLLMTETLKFALSCLALVEFSFAYRTRLLILPASWYHFMNKI